MSNSKPNNAEIYIKGFRDAINEMQKTVVNSSKKYQDNPDHDSLLLGDMLTGLFMLTIQGDKLKEHEDIVDLAIADYYEKKSVEAKVKITIVKEV